MLRLLLRSLTVDGPVAGLCLAVVAVASTTSDLIPILDQLPSLAQHDKGAKFSNAVSSTTLVP